MRKKVLSIFKRRGRIAVTMLLTVSLLTFGPMLAFAASGDQLWAARQAQNGNEVEVAADAAGNVYTAGGTYDATSMVSGYSINKYGTNGALLWSRTYTHGLLGYPDSQAYAIAIDGAGNAYVTGELSGDIATVKYSSNGNRLWTEIFSGAAGVRDRGNDIVVDGAGNVYVTGTVDDSSWAGGNYVTIKYDSAGRQQWVEIYESGGSDDARKVGLDADGNVYVTGWSQSSWLLPVGFATIKYSSTGTQKWVKRYDGSTTYYYADAAIDASGNVFISGTAGTASDGWLTLKYNSGGNLKWARNAFGVWYDGAEAIALDISGNVVVAGYTRSADGGNEVAVVKYDSSGSQLWTQQYDSGPSADDYAYDLAIDNAGNIYLGGETYSFEQDKFLTVKLNESGTAQWARNYNNGAGQHWISSIAVNGSGVYVAGISWRIPNDGTQAAIVKYAP